MPPRAGGAAGRPAGDEADGSGVVGPAEPAPVVGRGATGSVASLAAGSVLFLADLFFSFAYLLCGPRSCGFLVEMAWPRPAGFLCLFHFAHGFYWLLGFACPS